MKTTALAACFTAALSIASVAHAESLKVPETISGGVLNIRTGPGTNYALVGAAPAGTVFKWDGRATCTARRDGIRGADWCRVNYNGAVGWASSAGLMPVQWVISTTRDESVSAPDERTEYECGRPTVLVGDDVRDRNPVLSVNVSYDPSTHGWQVFHNRADGSVVSRSTQYSMVDYSNDDRMQWEGSLNRSRNIYMTAGLKQVNGNLVYFEEIIDRNLNGRLAMKMSVSCQEAASRSASLPVRGDAFDANQDIPVLKPGILTSIQTQRNRK